MFRTVSLLILMLVVSACAKDKESIPPASVTVQRIPSECTYQATAAHTFIDGYTYGADRYSCALHAKMTCNLYDSGGSQIEVVCEETNPALPQGIPNGCRYQGGSAISTVHQFIGYGLLYSATYDCGTIGDGMSCTYFSHPGNQCNDLNGTPADDCGAYQDDEVHEELRCSYF